MNVEDCVVAREGFPRPVPNTPTNVVEQFKMAGKVAVVTGAADGIGYAVAEGLAEAGASVALLYNSWVVSLQNRHMGANSVFKKRGSNPKGGCSVKTAWHKGRRL